MLHPAGARVNPQILIDAIVRQTTVLIARLSTVEGVRSPLGHIANEVFVGLVAELENQGVSKKVIADMFGMALRSYRQKVQRLGESVTARGVTLWTPCSASSPNAARRAARELFAQFQYDDEASVRGILNDLVESGLIVRSGRGDDTRYRIATAEELRDLGAFAESRPQDAHAALVWVQIYREGPMQPRPARTARAAVARRARGGGRGARRRRPHSARAARTASITSRPSTC